ncbi:hypothetical protein YC2023_014140 [Brassica napus]
MFLEVSTVHHSNVFCVHFSTSLKDLKLNLTEPTSYLNLFGVLCDHDFVVSFSHVSTLGYFASHYRVMRYVIFFFVQYSVICGSGFTNSPTTKCRRKLDEIYDLVTALIFRGFQRLTEETGKEENFKVELLAARGAMYVEVFNRVIPLAYNIIKRNKVNLKNIGLLFDEEAGETAEANDNSKSIIHKNTIIAQIILGFFFFFFKEGINHGPPRVSGARKQH